MRSTVLAWRYEREPGAACAPGRSLRRTRGCDGARFGDVGVATQHQDARVEHVVGGREPTRGDQRELRRAALDERVRLLVGRRASRPRPSPSARTLRRPPRGLSARSVPGGPCPPVRATTEACARPCRPSGGSASVRTPDPGQPPPGCLLRGPTTRRSSTGPGIGRAIWPESQGKRSSRHASSDSSAAYTRNASAA